MNDINLVLIILIIFLILTLFKNKELFALPTNHERPFVNVYDNNNNQLPIILLSHPLTRDNSYEQYKQYKKDNFLILGISSYNEFPSITTNKHDSLNNPKEKAWTHYNYMKLVDGWLHCFRNPEKHINKSMPKTLISESDFCNYDVYKPDPSIKKKYDFIYICPKDNDKCDGWVSINKNWNLAKECIKIMCQKYKLKGLLVGRKGCDLPKGTEKYLSTTGFLSQTKLIEAYNECKFILIPNKSDASPRVLTEAMCVNLPILLNYNIVGGWKYISEKTGAFFKNKDDFEQGLQFILNNYSSMEPRNVYINRFSYSITGVKFKKFVQKYYPDKIDLSEIEYLKL